MIVHALEKDKDLFRPKETRGGEVLGVEYSYISVIGAFMYLANNTRPDIAFAAPTMHHWNNIKNILRYLNGTIDLGLFF
jgi:hypothetical protein